MDLLNDLMQIGFTEYEAKVYLALIRESPANGYQISKRSGVPRSMVYEALGRLHARGAVLETIEGRATLYRPLPPHLLLDRHMDEHSRLVNKLRKGLQELYNAPEEEGVWSISGRRAVLAYASQMIQEAQSELYMVLTDQDLDALREGILAACERGVIINTLLTGKAKLDCGQVVYHPPLESELQDLTGTLLIVMDNREALIAGADYEMTAAITRNRNLVLIARQFVWMELFTQRVYARLGADLLERLEPEDRQIFESLNEHAEA